MPHKTYITWLGSDRPALVDLLGPLKKMPPDGDKSAGGEVEGNRPAMQNYTAKQTEKTGPVHISEGLDEFFDQLNEGREKCIPPIPTLSPNTLDSHRRLPFLTESHLSTSPSEKRYLKKLGLEIADAARKAKASAGDSKTAWKLMFEFARRVRSLPAFVDKPNSAGESVAVAVLDTYGMFADRSELIGAMDCIDQEDFTEEFASAFVEVRHFDKDQVGDVFDQAVHRMKVEQVFLAGHDGEALQRDVHNLLRLAGVMQCMFEKKPIVLPQERVAAVLWPGKPMSAAQPKASRLIRKVIAMPDSPLKRVRLSSRPKNGGPGRAAEFRFDVSAWSCLAELAGQHVDEITDAFHRVKSK